jgi:hypothetical protein
MSGRHRRAAHDSGESCYGCSKGERASCPLSVSGAALRGQDARAPLWPVVLRFALEIGGQVKSLRDLDEDHQDLAKNPGLN